MTPFTEENINAFFERSNQFVQDDYNLDLLRKFIEHCGRQGYELTIESLAAFIKRNEQEFHWLRDEQEIAALRAAAAKPQPEPGRPKLQGSVAEKLWQVGVEPTRHVSHAERLDNDRKHASVLQQIVQAARKTQADIERQTAINEARSIVIYRAGRVSHGETESARKAALAKLGISE